MAFSPPDEATSYAQPPTCPQPSIAISRIRKLHIVTAGMIYGFNSGLGSSLPSGATRYISQAFNVTDDIQLTLLNSLYLLGFAIGPPIFGPLSEHLGRRPVLVGSYAGLMLFTLACSFAPTFGCLLLFRLMCGVNAAVPNAIVGGLYADVFDDPASRGNAMTAFMFVTGISPMMGPIFSALISPVSWKWTFWLACIAAGTGFPIIVLLPETYAPVLEKVRNKEDISRTQCSVGLDDANCTIPPIQTTNRRQAVRELGNVFSRPLIMVIHEPILLASSLYLALVYAILYLFFQAYPIVFQELYGLSPTIASLAFIPLILGSCVALLVFLWYGRFYAKSVEKHDPWTQIEEYRRLPLACGAGPTVVVALFWLGWTSRTAIHPLVPAASGIFFGSGYLLIFMAMNNFITDRYKTASASAHAAASTIRSIIAMGLPLLTRSMYNAMGVAYATSLLGFLAAVSAMIPFVWIKYRHLLHRE